MATNNGNQLKKKLYFLNQEYRPGMVYQQLPSEPYEAVIGIDVGHGECMAYIYYKTSKGDWIPESLYVTEDRERYIPSYIAYYGEQIVIGKDAKDLSCVITDIKQEPKDWGKPSADGRHTNKKILQDFITGLWKNIRSKNELVRSIQPKKLLITVGCPASHSWTDLEYMGSYVDLVKTATGYPNVVILPESTAAIMTPIYSKLNIDVSSGVAVYDLGSSTIDFTYILMGKVLFTASLRLGGYDIDKAMLRKVAKDNTFPMDDVNSMKYSTARTKLRFVKESFYNSGKIPKEESVDITMELDFCVSKEILDHLQGHEDENTALLDMILQSHNMESLHIAPKRLEDICNRLQDAREEFLLSRKPVFRSIVVKVPLNYNVDTEMMRCVLEEDTTVSSQLEPPYKGLSWLDCVDKFFEKTHDRIMVRGLPCNAVILTGGTSKITEVQQIADQYYPGKRRGGETDTEKIDTASSVAKGLCLVKGHESQAAEQLQALKKDIKKAAVPFYDVFCENFAKEKLFDRIWNVSLMAIRNMNDGNAHTEDELRAEMNKLVAPGSVFMDQIRFDLRRYVRGFMRQKIQLSITDADESSCVDVIQEKTNMLAKEVYQVEAGSLPELPSNLVDTMAQTMDTQSIEKLIHATGVNMSYTAKRLAVKFLHRGFGKFFRHMRAIFSSALSPAEISDIVKTLSDPQIKEFERKNLGWDISLELKKMEILRDSFIGLVEQQLEVALGIVLFELFEEYTSL